MTRNMKRISKNFNQSSRKILTDYEIKLQIWALSLILRKSNTEDKV